MTDYTELVKALRYCSTTKGMVYCNVNCKYGWEERSKGCNDLLMTDAAAAIEALQAEVDALKHDIERYVGINAELTTENEALHERIEALQAQLSKRGEWQKAKPHGVVTYSDGYAECSHCHEAIWLGWGMNFCPHCGTQNKIIDPDDYDGAKMGVQDESAGSV